MRIDPNMVPTILADLQQSQMSLNTALQEVSTGKSVNVPSDNPAAAAAMVENTIETGDVDQYTQNVSSVLSTVQSGELGFELGGYVADAGRLTGHGRRQRHQLIRESAGDGHAGAGDSFNVSYRRRTLRLPEHIYLAGPARRLRTRRIHPHRPATPTTATTTQTPWPIGDNLSVQVNIPGSQIFSNASNNVLDR